MATKKKSSKPRRAARAVKRGVRRVAKNPAPVAASVGIGLGAVRMATTAHHPKSTATPMEALMVKSNPVGKRVGDAINIAIENAKSADVLAPVAAGILISAAGPKIPVVGKEINKTVKRISKNKAVL